MPTHLREIEKEHGRTSSNFCQSFLVMIEQAFHSKDYQQQANIPE